MSAPVQVGDILAGKYRVERVIGEGGMGVVVCATHLQLDQLVAIKFLLPEGLASAEVVGRFAREARAAAKIKSEHVARVIDVSSLENGAPYMVMEYLEGCDLSESLQERKIIPFDEAATYVLQACEAIAEAHAAGIIHRDLKPANLYLAKRPDQTRSIKVLDFGISKMTDPVGGKDFALTKTASILGSPLYMSPEQLGASKDLDVRADIWALGVILYELTTGNVPFGGDSLSELIVGVLQKAPDSMCAQRPELPPGFEAVVLRCLAKDRAARFPNIAELARALGPYSRDVAGISFQRISRILGSTQPGFALPATIPGVVGATTDPATLVESTAPKPYPSVPPQVPADAKTQGSWAAASTPAVGAPPKKRSVVLPVIAAITLVFGGLAVGGYVLRNKLTLPIGSRLPERVTATTTPDTTPTAETPPPRPTAAVVVTVAPPVIDAPPAVTTPPSASALAKKGAKGIVAPGIVAPVTPQPDVPAQPAPPPPAPPPPETPVAPPPATPPPPAAPATGTNRLEMKAK